MMENNKQFEDKLHVPPMSELSALSLQDDFCTAAVGCVEECEDCLFSPSNQQEFTNWLNAKIKPLKNGSNNGSV